MPLDLVDIIRTLDLRGFLYFFWYFVIFDLSRYTISLLTIALGAWFERRRDPGRYDGPVSIMLTGHNEGKSLRKSVMSLREQSHQHTQIIVVDDGSTDDMREQAQQLKKEGIIDRYVSSGVRGGKASALNLGLYYCMHDVVVSMDVDTSLDRDAVEKIIRPFSDHHVGAVAGNLAIRNREDSLMTSLQALEYFSSISVGRRFTSQLGILTIVSGAFGAFRKSALKTVGGWDVGPGDDGNITNKLRRGGWQIQFAHEAWAMTDCPKTLLAYHRQRLRWNRSVIRYKLRKFRSVFNPFSAQFNGYDLAGIFNILFFQVFLAMSYFAYLIWLFTQLGEFAFVVIGVTIVIYFIEDLLTFIMVCCLYRDKNPWPLAIYLPLYNLFDSYVVRILRLYAYVNELIFRRSYQDTFTPTKVQNVLERF
jgi:cellulose synthase/poly-beta-1,6-N-acetylglucosamine synthase-like glycosyltransferase